MSEQSMIELAQAALEHHGISDTVIAVGQFSPRGQSGASFAAGMVGDELAGGVGMGAGFIAGRRANAMSAGFPPTVIVAVSESTVYGMHSRSRRHEPDEVLFTLPRAQLTAKVHQRVNVRVLELIDDETGANVQLEGNRLPITHSKDVIHVLTESSGQPTA
jgi:hypothetical protein